MSKLRPQKLSHMVIGQLVFKLRPQNLSPSVIGQSMWQSFLECHRGRMCQGSKNPSDPCTHCACTPVSKLANKINFLQNLQGYNVMYGISFTGIRKTYTNANLEEAYQRYIRPMHKVRRNLKKK